MLIGLIVIVCTYWDWLFSHTLNGLLMGNNELLLGNMIFLTAPSVTTKQNYKITKKKSTKIETVRYYYNSQECERVCHPHLHIASE